MTMQAAKSRESLGLLMTSVYLERGSRLLNQNHVSRLGFSVAALHVKIHFEHIRRGARNQLDCAPVAVLGLEGKGLDRRAPHLSREAELQQPAFGAGRRLEAHR